MTSNSRGLINVASGLLSPVTKTIVGIVLTPLLLSELGMEAYSYWPLCNSMLSYVGIINVAVGSSVSRYTVLALDTGKIEKARDYFNTGLLIVFSFAMLAVLGGALVSWQLPGIIEIKPGLQGDVQSMFLFLILGTVLGVFTPLFFIGTYASNQIYIEKTVRAVAPLFRLLAVALLFVVLTPSLSALGIAALMESSVILLTARVTLSRFAPEIRMRPSAYPSRRSVNELVRFSGWVLLAAVGSYFFRVLQLLLANRLLGPSEAGRYGIVLQVTSVVTTVSGHVGYVVSRKLLAAIADGAVSSADATLRRYFVWTMGAFSLPVGLLFLHIEPLFLLWVGDSGHGLSHVFRVAAVLTFLIQPLSLVNSRLLVSNRVTTNGLFSLLLGPGLVILAWVMTSRLNWGLTGLVAAASIVLLVRNLALVIDAYHTCSLDLRALIHDFAVASFALSGVLIVGFVRGKLLPSTGLVAVAVDACLGAVVWALILWSLAEDWRDLMLRLVHLVKEKTPGASLDRL